MEAMGISHSGCTELLGLRRYKDQVMDYALKSGMIFLLGYRKKQFVFLLKIKKS